eukprot:37916-Chlamydomonas_euryale.AAC.1
MPELGCGWSGQAVLPGQWVMMNANCGKGVIIHELGHNYGLMHSNVLVRARARAQACLRACVKECVGGCWRGWGRPRCCIVIHARSAENYRLMHANVLGRRVFVCVGGLGRVRPEQPV